MRETYHRERERQTDRQTDRQRETETETYRDRQADRQTDTDRDRDRQTDKERRQIETERGDRQTDRQRAEQNRKGRQINWPAWRAGGRGVEEEGVERGGGEGGHRPCCQCFACRLILRTSHTEIVAKLLTSVLLVRARQTSQRATDRERKTDNSIAFLPFRCFRLEQL